MSLHQFHCPWSQIGLKRVPDFQVYLTMIEEITKIKLSIVNMAKTDLRRNEEVQLYLNKNSSICNGML